jgi:hypothetical protein
MVANPGVFQSDSRGPSKGRTEALLSVARRRAGFTGLLPPEAEQAGPVPRESMLLEYAAFVLEQEAEYCQQ